MWIYRTVLLRSFRPWANWSRAKVTLGIATGNESVTLAGYRLKKAWLFGIVSQCLTDLSNCGINAMDCVNVNVLSPESASDLLPSDQIAFTLGKKDQQLHRDTFKFDRASPAT